MRTAPEGRHARRRRSLLLAIVVSTVACAGPTRAVAHGKPATSATSPSFPSRPLEELMRSHPRLAQAVDDASDHRFQVLLGVPDADGKGWARREGFRVDAEYFYPASAIKPCIALAALDALSELNDATSAEFGVRSIFRSEHRRQTVTVGNLVNGSLIVSDNDASNDLLDLVGLDGLHQRLWRLGLPSVRVRHRMGQATEDVRHAPRIELLSAADANKRSTVVVPARDARLDLGKNDDEGLLIGDSFVANGQLVDEPMSFEEKNRISLQDLQDTMVALMRPELRPADQRPRLGESERAAIVDALTTLPKRWGMSAAAEAEHKPLLPGLERVRSRASLTVASKSGRAFGFLVANAYVADKVSGRSFFLTTAVYANANGRINDDLYQYESFAYPLLADLGEVVARSVFDGTPEAARGEL